MDKKVFKAVATYYVADDNEDEAKKVLPKRVDAVEVVELGKTNLKPGSPALWWATVQVGDELWEAGAHYLNVSDADEPVRNTEDWDPDLNDLGTLKEVDVQAVRAGDGEN
jgi:hypothetical protein